MSKHRHLSEVQLIKIPCTFVAKNLNFVEYDLMAFMSGMVEIRTKIKQD